MLRHVVTALLAFTALTGGTSSTRPALAWGQEGHSLIAEVAQRRLSPEASIAVEQLLGRGHSLASIASWADDARASRPETYNWHFVDMPIASPQYDASSACESTPKGDCVVAELERLKRDLSCTTGLAKAEALKFAVHFIGDIHQPFHTVEESRGATEIAVDLFMRGFTCTGNCQPLHTPTNLHVAWDSGLILKTVWAWGAYVDRLEEGWLITPDAQVPNLDGGTPSGWAEEAHGTAQRLWSLLPQDHVLNDAYFNAALPIIDRQLAVAGPRAGRRSGGSQPHPAPRRNAAQAYAPGRGAIHALKLLEGYAGIVQCDGYSAYKTLVDPAKRRNCADRIALAFCWSHLRQRFVEIERRGPAPTAKEALHRVVQLYAIERSLRGRSAEERRAGRHAHSKPLVLALKAWFEERLTILSGKSLTAEAIRYGLNHWEGLTHFLDDGRIEMDTNAVERAMRPICLNRKNALFQRRANAAICRCSVCSVACLACGSSGRRSSAFASGGPGRHERAHLPAPLSRDDWAYAAARGRAAARGGRAPATRGNEPAHQEDRRALRLWIRGNAASKHSARSQRQPAGIPSALRSLNLSSTVSRREKLAATRCTAARPSAPVDDGVARRDSNRLELDDTRRSEAYAERSAQVLAVTAKLSGRSGLVPAESFPSRRSAPEDHPQSRGDL